MSASDSAPVTSGPVVLKPATLPGGQADSRMALRWCLTPDATSELRRRDINVADAYLFVVVAGVLSEDEHFTRYDETHRYLVPLSQAEQIVWFDYAGANEVFATVVWPDDGYKSMRKHLMSTTSGGQYRSSVLDEWEQEFRYFGGSTGSLHGTTRLRVEVDEGVFGQAPPAWVTKFIGLFYADPLGRIQCDTRRQALGAAIPRLLGSLVVVPLLELFQAILVAVLAICGKRDVNYSAFRHPYRDGPSSITRGVTTSRWFVDNEGDPRGAVWVLVNPIVGVVLAAVWTLLVVLSGWAWWIVIAGMPATMALVLAIGLAFIRFAPGIIDTMTARHRNRRQQAAEAARRDRAEALTELSCQKFDEREARLTVRLRWDHLKARLCKPYAKTRR